MARDIPYTLVRVPGCHPGLRTLALRHGYAAPPAKCTSYMDPVDTSSACDILRYAWCVRPDLAKAVSCAEPIAKDCGAMSAKASWFALFTRGLASPPLASI